MTPKRLCGTFRGQWYFLRACVRTTDTHQVACTTDTNGKGKARERILPETVEYVDNLGQVSDSCSSLSSFGSISTDASSSSGITVVDKESGTDSDSDSE